MMKNAHDNEAGVLKRRLVRRFVISPFGLVLSGLMIDRLSEADHTRLTPAQVVRRNPQTPHSQARPLPNRTRAE